MSLDLPLHPWLGIVLVMGTLSAVQGGISVLGTKTGAHPETMRKLLHIIMGLVCVPFPWLFGEVWPVLLLSGLASGWVLAVKSFAPLRAVLGAAGNSIDRESYGDVLFCLGVAAAFWASGGAYHPDTFGWLIYVVAILVLAFSDAAAALVGIRIGKLKYDAVRGQKSIEGSVAFLLVTMVCVVPPLLIWSPLAVPNVWLVAFNIAVLVMLMEAISWRGTDNLAVPLGTLALLEAYWGATTQELLLHGGAALVITGFTVYWRGRTNQDHAGAIGAALVGFAAWALGGWVWFVPALVMFVGYNMIYGRTSQQFWRGSPILGVLATTSASLFWLFLMQQLKRPEYFWAFNAAFAAHMACVGVGRLALEKPADLSGVFIPRVLVGWALLAVPFVPLSLVLHKPWVPVILEVSVMLLATLAAAVLFFPCMPKVEARYSSVRRWSLQASIVLLVTALGQWAVEDLLG